MSSKRSRKPSLKVRENLELEEELRLESPTVATKVTNRSVGLLIPLEVCHLQITKVCRTKVCHTKVDGTKALARGTCSTELSFNLFFFLENFHSIFPVFTMMREHLKLLTAAGVFVIV